MQMNPLPATARGVLAAMVAILFITLILYLPGLHSGFYGDDYPNLAGLADIESDGHTAFVFSGVAGPGGRPLSLLTFAMQHEHWPHDPFAFKAINLLLHIFSGVLVFFLCRELTRQYPPTHSLASALGIGAAALWLLHPLHVSTVLYAVQRMAQLSALFMLLAAFAFVRGRALCVTGRVRSGYVLMTAAVMLGTLLAVFSKENGALLPLLLLVIDATLLHGMSAPPRYRLWRMSLLVLPSAALVAYLCSLIPKTLVAFSSAEYSIGQKLLTEAVVLVTYVTNLIVPQPSAYTIYQYDFPVSRGLLDPPVTLAALLILVSAVILALRFRRQHPLPAFGVLWFLTGHLLESTFLNLRIYFEHRNYLPSVGLLLVLAWLFIAGGQRLGKPVVGGIALTLFAALLAWTTFVNLPLWTQPLLSAEERVRLHPDSPLALASLGNQLLLVGRTDQAWQLYETTAARFPNIVLPRLRQLAIQGCVRNALVPEPLWEELQHRSRFGEGQGLEVVSEINNIASAIYQRNCPTIDQERLLALLESLAENPEFLRQHGSFFQLAGNLSLYRKEPARAEKYFAAATRVSPTWASRMQYIDVLLRLNNAAAAALELQRLRREMKFSPLTYLGYAEKVTEYERRIQTITVHPSPSPADVKP